MALFTLRKKRLDDAGRSIKTGLVAPVASVERYCPSDYSAGIFTRITFAGCPLSCRYCDAGAAAGRILEADGVTPVKGIELLSPHELAERFRKDGLYYQVSGGGLILSGGEPTAYSVFIASLCRYFSPYWKIILHTSLHCHIEDITRMASVVTRWIIDLKDMNDAIYGKYTGQKSYNRHILQHFVRAVRPRDPELKSVTVLLPLLPGYNSGDDVERSRRELQEMGFTDIRQIKIEENRQS